MKKSIPLAFVSFALLAVVAGCAVIATPIPPTFTAIPPTFTPDLTLTPTPSPTITAEPTSTPPVDVLKFFTDIGATVMTDEEAQRFKGNVVYERSTGLQRISSMRQFVVFDPWDKSINFVFTKEDLIHYLDMKGGKIIVIADEEKGLITLAKGGSIILKAHQSGIRINWISSRLDSSFQTDLFMGDVLEWKGVSNNPLNEFNLSIIDFSTSKPKPIGFWLSEKGTFDEMVKYLESKGYDVKKLKFVVFIDSTRSIRKEGKLPIIKEDW